MRSEQVRRLAAILRGMPPQATDPGAPEQLAVEMQELAAARRRATAAMLDEDAPLHADVALDWAEQSAAATAEAWPDDAS